MKFSDFGKKTKDFFVNGTNSVKNSAVSFANKVKTYDYKSLPSKTKVAATSNSAIKLYSSLACIIISVIIGFLILIFMDSSNVMREFETMLLGGTNYGSAHFFSILANAAPLLCCGLSIVFANKTGMFNIGVAGQYTIGILGSLMFALQFNMPWYVCVLAAVVFGAIWGVIPGVLKAYLNVSEVLSGIMLNWIALFFTNYSFQTYLSSCVNAVQGMKTYDISMKNPSALLPQVGSQSYFTIAIFIAIIVAIFIAFILKKTTLGFQLKASGLNKDATKYAGMNEKRNIIVSLAISGALAALGASLFYLAGLEQYDVQASSALKQLPWNGIVVAFVGQLSPVGTIFATLFTSWITHGAQMMLQTSYPFEIADIITSIIVYLSGLTGLVIILVNKHVFKNKAKKEELALQAANADTPVSSQKITENIIPDNANEKGGKE